MVLRRAQGGQPAGSVAIGKCPLTHPGAGCDASAAAALREFLAQPLRPLPQVCEVAVCSDAACGPGGLACAANAIASENREPGSPPSEWDVAG